MRTHLRCLIVLVVAWAVVGTACAVEPFNGKDLTGWKLRGKPEQSHWKVGTATLDPENPACLRVAPGGNEMINDIRPGTHGVDINTEEKFGDAIIELELMVPARSNSGVYAMGEYEIQVLDSFGVKKPGVGDMGAVYSIAAPKENACLKPGEWQTLSVEYQAPKFDAAGKKTANARIVKAVLNGKLIHENVEAPRSTGGGVTGKEAPTGPLMFQGNHGAVALRKIKVTPLPK